MPITRLNVFIRGGQSQKVDMNINKPITIELQQIKHFESKSITKHIFLIPPGLD